VSTGIAPYNLNLSTSWRWVVSCISWQLKLTLGRRLGGLISQFGCLYRVGHKDLPHFEGALCRL